MTIELPAWRNSPLRVVVIQVQRLLVYVLEVLEAELADVYDGEVRAEPEERRMVPGVDAKAPNNDAIDVADLPWRAHVEPQTGVLRGKRAKRLQRDGGVVTPIGIAKMDIRLVLG